MASAPATVSLQEVRSLAHKLYIQCCDSSSAFNSLRKSVRSLRNQLEDVDDVLDPDAISQPESRAVTRAAVCYLLLQQLDLAIQHYRCSANKGSDGLSRPIIADFKTAIDVATQEFANVCEGFGAPSGNDELRLDTALSPSPHAPFVCRWPSSASEAPRMAPLSGSLDKRSSPSLPSLLSSCASAPSSIADSVIEAQAAEEKEVLSANKVLDLTTECATGVCSRPADVPSWRTPFAMVDPLSVCFEEATTVILENNEPKGDLTSDLSQSSLSVGTNDRSSTTETTAEDRGNPALKILNSSPTCVVAPLKTRSPTAQSPTGIAKDIGTCSDFTLDRHDSRGTLGKPSKARESGVASPDETQQLASACSSYPRDMQSSTSLDTTSPMSPAQPSRAPPSPAPPVPRRSKTHDHTQKISQGRYRIVNATPEEVESDDELYTISRPSSMVVAESDVVNTFTAARNVPFADVLENQAGRGASDDEGLPRPDRPPPALSPGVGRNLSDAGMEDCHDAQCGLPTIPPRPNLLKARSTFLSKKGTEAIAEPPKPKVAQFEDRIQLGITGNHHKSADEVLANKPLPPLSPAPNDIQGRSHDRLNSRARLEGEIWSRSERIHEFNGPVAHPEEYQLQPGNVDLDGERLDYIVDNMNSCSWDNAESCLQSHLQTVIARRNRGATRRILYLLGVCASLKGQLQAAINYFKTVIRTPIKDITRLDVGDCAAAYWLGDAYALLNRKAEALLAYTIAARSPMYQDASQPKLQLLIKAEQEACEVGISRADLSAEWLASSKDMAADGSILHPNVLSFEASMSLLCSDTGKKQSSNRRLSSWLPSERLAKAFWLRSDHSRGYQLHSLHTGVPAPALNDYYRISLTASMLTGESEHWPMPYDPFFCMANVSRGRLLAHECDLLQTFAPDSTAQLLPKSRSLPLTRNETFTHATLPWLIKTTRECLAELEIDYTEISEPGRARFACRYTFMQKKIATTHYFSIALVRPLMGSGYAIEIASDGVCGSRLAATGEGYDSDVDAGVAKGLRQSIKEAMEEQAKLAGTRLAGNGVLEIKKGKGAVGKALKKAASISGGQFAYRIAI